jgi:hypothetical protein
LCRSFPRIYLRDSCSNPLHPQHPDYLYRVIGMVSHEQVVEKQDLIPDTVTVDFDVVSVAKRVSFNVSSRVTKRR